MATVLIPDVPKQTPFLDKEGRVSTPWVYWLQQITAAGVIVSDLQSAQVVAEDNSTDGNSAAILAEILDYISLTATTQRAPEVCDDSPDPQIALLRADVDELRACLAAAIENANAWRAEVDELRALIAGGDVFPGAQVANMISAAAVTGASGTITIPKLTTANGSITVSNGAVTAFTNPT